MFKKHKENLHKLSGTFNLKPQSNQGCLGSFYTAYRDSQLVSISVLSSFTIIVLDKSKLQMFLKSFERLFHITDPKHLIEFAP